MRIRDTESVVMVSGFTITNIFLEFVLQIVHAILFNYVNGIAGIIAMFQFH